MYGGPVRCTWNGTLSEFSVRLSWQCTKFSAKSLINPVKYLLACPECGSKLAVETGQAGQRLQCACGREIEVPSVRQLRELEPAGDVGPVQAPWSARQGLLFLGIAIIVVSAVAAVAIAIMRPGIGYEKLLTLKLDKDAIQHEVNALSPTEAYAKVETDLFIIPGYSEQLARGSVPLLLLPCQKLLAGFEGKGPTALAPQATEQLMQEAMKRGAEINARMETRQTLNDWLWLAGIAAVIGLFAACSWLVIPSRPQRKPVRAG
jgi:hypothetical protein